jgi:hypothetical protein
MTRPNRSKKEYKFWLYHDLLEDTRLMDYVDYLRKTHQFPTVIRNALRLVWTLGEGDLSVLFELFPVLRGQFMPNPDELIEQFRQMLHMRTITAAEPEPPSGPFQLELPLGLAPREVLPPPKHLSESLEQAIQEAIQTGIQQVLDQLAKMQPSAPLLVDYPAMKLDHAAPPIAMPTFNDDDEVVVRRDTSTNSDAAANFLAAASSFQEREDD